MPAILRLRDERWERIREHFPEDHVADGRPGRKRVPMRAVLEAVRLDSEHGRAMAPRSCDGGPR